MTDLALPAEIQTAVLAAGTTLRRVHRRSHEAIYFDRSDLHRFNAPAGEYGICYLGETLEVSFLETLVRGSNHRVVPRTHLQVRYGSPIALRRALRLFQFHSEGLVRIGCSADVPHLVPYSHCQRIALEVWRNHDDVDGIEYRSRWNDHLMYVALFDRAVGALEHGSARVPLDDLNQIRPILRRYAIGVI